MDLEDQIRKTLRREAGSGEPDTQRAWADLSRALDEPRVKRRRIVVGVALLSVVAVAVMVLMLSRERSLPPQPSATCAAVAFFHDHEYNARNAVVHPFEGGVLGQARIPGCNDTGQSSPPSDQFVEVARIPDVPPRLAVVEHADLPTVVYVRAGVKPPFPPELARLFVAPGCRPNDAPLKLEGTWLSIGQPDGHTELDMLPPYDVGILVTHASSALYLRAELLIRVSTSLGTPLTHEDVVSILWTGGAIHVVATCDGGRFVATSVTPVRS